MPTRRFERIALAQLLVGGCAVAFSLCDLIEPAQAQATYVPPPPTQSPTLNPSNPGTVPQPSYRPITPSTPSISPTTPSTVPSVETTPPANEQPSIESTTTRGSERTSDAETRTVHAHHHRGHYIVVRPSLGSYSCGDLGCVRTYAWAFPCQYYSRYCYLYGYYQPHGRYRY